ncbi:MAG: hypothetical protein WC397_01160 [Candidatus Paceibacterota bacterium]|jgi:endoglucanase
MEAQDTKNYLRLLQKFCSVPGISGSEGKTGISGAILEELNAMDPKRAFEDEFGNVIAVFGSGDKKILLDAHIDEVGFEVAENIKDRGIFLSEIGQMNPVNVEGARVYVISNNIKGKIAVRDGLFMFVPDKAEDAGNILARELVSFDRYFESDGEKVKAIALDNRVGCAAIAEIISSISLPKDISIITVFSSGEEMKRSTVGQIAAKYKPDFGIVIDAAYAQPIDMDPSRTSIPEMGNGCAIQRLGEDFVVKDSVIERFEKLARENDIKCQPEIPLPELGRTNLPYLEKNGIEAGAINIPVRYQHTAYSEFSVNDAMEAVKLIKVFIENF